MKTLLGLETLSFSCLYRPLNAIVIVVSAILLSVCCDRIKNGFLHGQKLFEDHYPKIFFSKSK